ncbi:MAG: cupredoxin domain-containing protein [candidate division NC10 bacterium]|nr:cupredoxin domain-containing protein [candidate division NC10 bacterium]
MRRPFFAKAGEPRGWLLLGIGAALCLGVAGLAVSRGPHPGAGAPVPQSLALSAKGMTFNGANPTLQVRPGVPVELIIRNEEPAGILHDLVVPGLGVRSHILRPGESVRLRFTPAREGEYGYACTLHPRLMDGRLVVRR